MDTIARRLTPQPVKVRAGTPLDTFVPDTLVPLDTLVPHVFDEAASNSSSDIEVACYAYEGIDAVKAALRAGLAVSTEDFPIKVS